MYSLHNTPDQEFTIIQNSLNDEETAEGCEESATDCPYTSFIACCLVPKETSGILFYSLCVPSEWVLAFWMQLIQSGKTRILPHYIMQCC